MLFSVLRMDNRLRLNLFLLALIFGVGVLPKAVEAINQCYECQSRIKDPEDCTDNFKIYAKTCSSGGDYCIKHILDSKVVSRHCLHESTEHMDCLFKNLGSNCYSDIQAYRNAQNKCRNTGTGDGAAAAAGREAINEGDSNTNGTEAPPSVTVSSSTESRKETDLDDEQARQSLGSGEPSSSTRCFCKGNLCNDNKKSAGAGTGAGATIALSNRLIFFVIGVAVASTKYSLG